MLKHFAEEHLPQLCMLGAMHGARALILCSWHALCAFVATTMIGSTHLSFAAAPCSLHGAFYIAAIGTAYLILSFSTGSKLRIK